MSKIKIRTSLYIMVGILSGITSLTAISVAPNTVSAKNVDYKVNLESSLVVTVPTNTVVLDINPATSAFSSKDLGVTVGTNNPTGYTLTMSADSTDLTKTTGTAAVIPTLEELSGGYTESTFTVNHWGYKLPTTNYLPFATNVQLDSTNAPTVSKTSTVTFGAKANVEQPAGAYELEINFAAVANPLLPTLLYDNIASLSKGKNTDPESHFSWTEITEPTSEIPSADTSTSGVFEWDGMTAGNGVDSNGGSQKIYFYRGILETNPGTYGSDGSANAYPNYVKLANNTCWRIVRTTSTGGVKIIYNGTWKNSTCANSGTAAQLANNSSFNNDSATVSGTTYTGLQYQNIHAVGYTYSNLAAGTTAATPISTIFGSTGNDTTTNTNSSIIKQYLDSWYSDNATKMTDYTSKLEGDAGYCNDRTLNTGTSWTTPLADNADIIPYGNAGMTQYYFGSYPRNANSSTFSPTLTCPRGKVDLYSYANNAGNGNGQLDHPVALLTADEASLAGNGWSGTSAYNAKSYLRSGSDFWLLSPSYRRSNGGAVGFFVGSGSTLNLSGGVYGACGFRPVISLAPGTTVLGSGTATDPWVVQ